MSQIKITPLDDDIGDESSSGNMLGPDGFSNQSPIIPGDTEDNGEPNPIDIPGGQSTLSLGEISQRLSPENFGRPDELSQQFDALQRQTPLPQQAAAQNDPSGSRSSLEVDNRASTNIVTGGISSSKFIAEGIGIGADLGENYRPGGSFENTAGAYVVAGPIVSIPLPLPIPTFNASISKQPDQGVGHVDCSAVAMAATPFFSAQVLFDIETGEFKSFSLSVTIALQIGLAAGMYCGFGTR
jgi:hypothetical protein